MGALIMTGISITFWSRRDFFNSLISLENRGTSKSRQK